MKERLDDPPLRQPNTSPRPKRSYWQEDDMSVYSTGSGERGRTARDPVCQDALCATSFHSPFQFLGTEKTQISPWTVP